MPVRDEWLDLGIMLNRACSHDKPYVKIGPMDSDEHVALMGFQWDRARHGNSP